MFDFNEATCHVQNTIDFNMKENTVLVHISYLN